MTDDVAAWREAAKSMREQNVPIARAADAHVREHLEDFVGLSEAEAVAHAERLCLMLRICPIAGCEQDVALTATVTVYVDFGVVVRAEGG